MIGPFASSSRLAPSAALAVLLALFLALGLGSAAAQPATLAILPVKLLDTSGEPVDQSAEHARRLTEMGRQLADELARRYRTALVPAERLRSRCPEETPSCLLDAAGADLVLAGVVHKSSTLILQIFVRVADARTGRSRFARDLNFRGDGDEGWRRAATFLARQILEAPLLEAPLLEAPLLQAPPGVGPGGTEPAPTAPASPPRP